MPAIKKRITAEYLVREQRKEDARGDASLDGDKGNGDGNGVASPDISVGVTEQVVAPATKSKAGKPRQPLLLKGLDAELLFEKRKRTLAPSEQKLDTWLDNNLEKKAESSLPIIKLYRFYTDSCQLDSAQLVEMDHFKAILHNKFGKEFALKETSEYSGLLKESKPRKKPSVVSPSLTVKLRQFIDEALKASGNPSKGIIFAGIKKFISSNYPALQIELRPQVLKKALEREVYAGRVELVRGIGLCGYYRQPGPPAVEEDQKGKKKPGKEKAEGESGDSANDEGEDAVKEGGDGAGDGDHEEAKTDRRKAKNVQSDSNETQEDEEGKSDEDKKGEGEEVEKKGETDEKKKRKRKKHGKKIKHATTRRSHNNPKTLNDVFPLAITYMAEPKEASFVRIRKYLEKYYGQTDIDAKLKDCMEKGIKYGMWERVSGLGASGSFRLLVDSFNPSLADDLEDMATCAIVSCNEPKTASVRLMKSYISDYHPDFNVERKPFLLKKALERAEASNQLRRISGIGLSGSFQLVEHFCPSPAILAGEDDDGDDDSDYDVDEAKQEVYVVRKTKSGRRAPLERTQMDFSSSYKKKHSRASSGSGRARSSPGRGRPKTARGSPKKTISYAESSEEEENDEQSDEEPDEKVVDGYRPRPSLSRGGTGSSGSKIDKSKTPAKKSASKTVSKTFRAKVADRTKARPGKGRKAGKPDKRAASQENASSEEKEEEEEEEEEGEREEELLVTRRGKKPMPDKPGLKKGRRQETVASSEEEGEAPVTKKGRISTPGKKGRENVASSEEDESQEEEPPVRRKGKMSVPSKAGKRGRSKGTAASSEEDVQEDQDTGVLQTPKSAPRSKSSTPVKPAAIPASRKRGRPAPFLHSAHEKEAAKEAGIPSEDDDGEDHYIIEEEGLPNPAKKKRSGTPKLTSRDSAGTPKRGGGNKQAQESSAAAVVAGGGGRTPRSASQVAKRSLKEVDSGAESEGEEEEYVARPSSTRGGVGKR